MQFFFSAKFKTSSFCDVSSALHDARKGRENVLRGKKSILLAFTDRVDCFLTYFQVTEFHRVKN